MQSLNCNFMLQRVLREVVLSCFIMSALCTFGVCEMISDVISNFLTLSNEVAIAQSQRTSPFHRNAVKSMVLDDSNIIFVKTFNCMA